MSLSRHLVETTPSQRELRKFRTATGFLTNFSESDLPKFQAAVDEYKKIAPEVQLEIGDGWKYTKHALYCKSGRCDLSAFWRYFERLEAVYKLKEEK